MTVRRMKTYTGQTGYVYQYYFVGQREALASIRNRRHGVHFRRDLRPQDHVCSKRLYGPAATQAWCRPCGDAR